MKLETLENKTIEIDTPINFYKVEVCPFCFSELRNAENEICNKNWKNTTVLLLCDNGHIIGRTT